MNINRRNAIKNIAAYSMAGVLLLDNTASSNEQIQEGLKISCSSLAFNDMDWKQALKEIHKFGFRYADLAMFEGWTHLNPSELENPKQHGKEIVRVCNEIGIHPIALHANFNPLNEQGFPGLTTYNTKAQDQIVHHFTRVADCAQNAKIPLVNIQPGRFIEGKPKEESINNAIRLFRRLQPVADERSIILTFENHAGSIGEQPENTLAILEGVEGLRLDYDPSHIVSKSIPLQSTLPLMKYIEHIGIRNAVPGNYNQPIQDSKMDYDLEAFLTAFREANISAYISVEYFQPDMRPHIAKLKDILIEKGVPLL